MTLSEFEARLRHIVSGWGLICELASWREIVEGGLMNKLLAVTAVLVTTSPALAAGDIITLGGPPPSPDAVPAATAPLPPAGALVPGRMQGMDPAAAALDAIRSSGSYRGPNLTYEDVLAAITRPVRLYDLNGDGLSRDELDIPDEIQAAQIRAQAAMRFLPADLNNDRQVTRAEYDLVAKASPQFQRQPNAFEQADTNGDGIIS